MTEQKYDWKFAVFPIIGAAALPIILGLLVEATAGMYVSMILAFMCWTSFIASVVTPFMVYALVAEGKIIIKGNLPTGGDEE